MKYLTVIRHAKSSREDPDLNDLARPLNDRGKKAVPLVGKYLKQQQLEPDLMITSPATRALQTAIGIAEILSYQTEKFRIEQVIYFGDVKSIFEMIQHIESKYKDVFLFGHEPDLSSLIIKLTGNRLEKFSTCSAYRMSFDVKKWSDIRPKSGKCEFFVNPKLLGEK